MTPSRIRIAVALVGAALSAAALTSGAIAAERVGVASRVTLAQADPFHGEVLSRKAACERGRTVEVYRVDPGPDGLYDRTTSDAQGAWSIPAGMPSGRFYSVARQRPIDAPGKTIVCKRAVSPDVAFQGHARGTPAGANRPFGGYDARNSGFMMFLLNRAGSGADRASGRGRPQRAG